MHHDIQLFAEYAVTPFVGVWIETATALQKYKEIQKSHPSWVCGLKQIIIKVALYALGVTPFVGVWIETLAPFLLFNFFCVTPFVGVWIETLTNKRVDSYDTESHPSWVCGLKPVLMLQKLLPFFGHTLRGCVD